MRTKSIKSTLIPKKEVLQGEGSVWRIPLISVAALEALLKGMRADPLFSIVSAPAKAIRAIRLGADGPRAFSVVDECDTDRAGGKHPAHAHIAICRVQQQKGVAIEDPAFIAAHRELVETLAKTRVWELPVPPQAA